MIDASLRLKLIAPMAVLPAGVDVAAATVPRLPVTTNPPLMTKDNGGQGRLRMPKSSAVERPEPRALQGLRVRLTAPPE